MPLKVIGAGQPRTGTLSLKHALEMLGFKPCHHMTELAKNPDRWPLWERAFEEKPVDWEEVFKGFVATVDAPGYFFYRELAERYPQAKLILTLRDPERWFDSMLATILAEGYRQKIAQTPISGVFAKMLAYAAKKRGMGVPGGSATAGPPDRASAIAGFEAHNAEVRKTIPAARLLVYEVSQGWAPLCRFLGVPVPDAPFPRFNETGKWQSILPIVSKM
jgi:hypothetical protein